MDNVRKSKMGGLNTSPNNSTNAFSKKPNGFVCAADVSSKSLSKTKSPLDTLNLKKEVKTDKICQRERKL